VNAFDIAAVLLTIAAVSGYLNHRFLRLPATSGTLAIALVSSLVVIATGGLLPSWTLQDRVRAFLADIDFNQTLMRGFLSFLLFAGALHVNLEGLWRNKGTIATLSTVGVLISTAVVGVLTWWSFQLLTIPIPLVVALVYGALISPTDPIAVMGLLRELRAPENLEAQIAGESLFNDGIGVVVFLAFVSVAELPGMDATVRLNTEGVGPAGFFLRQVGGGALLGLGLGYVGYRALKSLNEHSLELLITLALALGTYALAFRIDVSGPIAVVVAGLLIGNPGRRFAMSTRTREHVDAFWSMVDYVLNAVLFLLIGLQVFGVAAEPKVIVVGLVAIPIALIARALSVALPVLVIGRRGGFIRGLIPILTWSGLRGGISVALALSLPQFPGKDYILAATYAVVVFSILVQGLTTRRMLVYYRVGAPHVRERSVQGPSHLNTTL
jgi:CPA1 family monovalent cation:H+ antiporter